MDRTRPKPFVLAERAALWENRRLGAARAAGENGDPRSMCALKGLTPWLVGWKKKQDGRTNSLTLRYGLFFDKHVFTLRLDLERDRFRNLEVNHCFFGISLG